ncbi:MAG: glycerate kinase [Loigolactobacillus coryniformis]|uniref:glycerate kinase n=1 Tax=Loigolactobacillus coryniformis TaxID=1610 RepID=UPI00264963DF|nr:glycerate kinase [Loigolactobacillus coryniformis]MDN5953611.1 glycerate kinase [Loigolactobacillus coryniformis]
MTNNDRYAFAQISTDQVVNDQLAQLLEQALHQQAPAATLQRLPYLDDDYLTAIMAFYQQKVQTMTVTGPLEMPVTARYGVLAAGKIVVIDIRSLLGPQLIPEIARSPLTATSFGLGELMRKTRTTQTTDFIFINLVNITNDLGVGALEALGAKFTDSAGQQIHGGGKLGRLQQVDVTALATWQSLHYHFYTNKQVRGPLLGADGVTYRNIGLTGASPEIAKVLETQLQKFSAQVVAVNFTDCRADAKAELATGLGYCFQTFFGQVTVTDMATAFVKDTEMSALVQQTPYYFVAAHSLSYRTLLAQYNKRVIVLADTIKAEPTDNEVVLFDYPNDMSDADQLARFTMTLNNALRLIYFRQV